MLNRHQARHIGKIPGVSCLPAFSSYIPIIKVHTSYIHLRCPRLALYHRNDGLCRKPCRCKRRRGLRHGPTGTRPYPRRRTSPLTGNGQVPLSVCPAVRPFLFGKPYLLYPFYIPLNIYCCRSVYLLWTGQYDSFLKEDVLAHSYQYIFPFLSASLE